MCRHISQVLLDFLNFGETKSGLVRLIVHFEVLDLLKLVLRSPSDSFVAFFIFAWNLLFDRSIVN